MITHFIGLPKRVAASAWVHRKAEPVLEGLSHWLLPSWETPQHEVDFNAFGNVGAGMRVGSENNVVWESAAGWYFGLWLHFLAESLEPQFCFHSSLPFFRLVKLKILRRAPNLGRSSWCSIECQLSSHWVLETCQPFLRLSGNLSSS